MRRSSVPVDTRNDFYPRGAEEYKASSRTITLVSVIPLESSRILLDLGYWGLVNGRAESLGAPETDELPIGADCPALRYEKLLAWR